MPHADLIVPSFDLKHSGALDFKDFLKMFKGFFKKYDYDVDEKLYDTKTDSTGSKTTIIKWACDKKVDDYNKIFIKPSIILNSYKEAVVDGVKVIDGNLKVNIKVEIERDYDEKWKVSPVLRFFRSLYEKYVSDEKQDKITKEAKSVFENLKKELKQYLNV